MKMMLQQASSGLYFKSKGEWIADFNKARVFDDWADAYEYSIFQKVSDSFIVPCVGIPGSERSDPGSMSVLSIK